MHFDGLIQLYMTGFFFRKLVSETSNVVPRILRLKMIIRFNVSTHFLWRPYPNTRQILWIISKSTSEEKKIK